MNTRNWLALLPALSSLQACPAADVPASGPVFTVEGAVAHPGTQRWSEDTTAFEALRAAGPVNADADLTRVELLRTVDDRAQRLELDLARMLESGDSSSNVLVRAGDLLRVPSR